MGISACLIFPWTHFFFLAEHLLYDKLTSCIEICYYISTHKSRQVLEIEADFLCLPVSYKGPELWAKGSKSASVSFAVSSAFSPLTFIA